MGPRGRRVLWCRGARGVVHGPLLIDVNGSRPAGRLPSFGAAVRGQTVRFGPWIVPRAVFIPSSRPFAVSANAFLLVADTAGVLREVVPKSTRRLPALSCWRNRRLLEGCPFPYPQTAKSRLRIREGAPRALAMRRHPAPAGRAQDHFARLVHSRLRDPSSRMPPASSTSRFVCPPTVCTVRCPSGLYQTRKVPSARPPRSADGYDGAGSNQHKQPARVSGRAPRAAGPRGEGGRPWKSPRARVL